MIRGIFDTCCSTLLPVGGNLCSRAKPRSGSKKTFLTSFSLLFPMTERDEQGHCSENARKAKNRRRGNAVEVSGSTGQAEDAAGDRQP